MKIAFLKSSLVTLGFVSVASFASYQSSVDEDGCWDGLNSYGGNCIKMSNARWDKYTAKKLIVTYTNTCNHRIYLTYDIPSLTGTSKGSQGIGPGAVKNNYSFNATGKYRFEAVGSIKPSKDWVCNGKAGL